LDCIFSFSIRRFQSTHSRGVRHPVIKKYRRINCSFNPRTRGECDLKKYELLPGFVCWFQSTHSRGVRLEKYFHAIFHAGVSIHALAGSATSASLLYAQNQTGFNPRTRGECDKALKMNQANFAKFQSTHSRGVRLEYREYILIPSMFQSTHSRGVRLT